jgi:hypothetical protein
MGSLPEPVAARLGKAIEELASRFRSRAKFSADDVQDLAQSGHLGMYEALAEDIPPSVDLESYLLTRAKTAMRTLSDKMKKIAGIEVPENILDAAAGEASQELHTGIRLAQPKELNTTIVQGRGKGVQQESPNIGQLFRDQEAFVDPYTAQRESAAEAFATSKKGFLKNAFDRSLAKKLYLQGKSQADIRVERYGGDPNAYNKNITRDKPVINVRRALQGDYGKPEMPATQLRNAGYTPEQIKSAIDEAFATVKASNKQLKSPYPAELYLGIERRGGRWAFSPNQGLSPADVAKRVGRSNPVFKQYLETIRQRVTETLKGNK